jgi:hypothetical protein
MGGLVGYVGGGGEQMQLEQPYGTKKYYGKVPSIAHQDFNEYVPQIRKAVKTAEGNSRNHGVLSVPTKDSAEASRVLDNSIYNNLVRWHQAGRPGKFVDFMQKRWAPIGAKNDPKNLNKNWAPNVRKALKSDPNVDYEIMQANNIAMNQSPLGAFTV